jgi:hypothetical protein
MTVDDEHAREKHPAVARTTIISSTFAEEGSELSPLMFSERQT